MASQTFSPGPSERLVIDSEGNRREVPAGWELLPPGDAALTRRVKAAGDYWQVEQKKGRRTFSRGLFAPRETIQQIRDELAQQRSDPAFARRKKADASRREQKQQEYVRDFQASVLAFLDFHPRHRNLAGELARQISDHATPVGSGTVARTQRIPIEKRAAAAVIAWMRHQTTAYDEMKIPRIKGKRREVRRLLAEKSQQVLSNYRRDAEPPADCPLRSCVTDKLDQ
jgi:hypothetical protein